MRSQDEIREALENYREQKSETDEPITLTVTDQLIAELEWVLSEEQNA